MPAVSRVPGFVLANPISVRYIVRTFSEGKPPPIYPFRKISLQPEGAGNPAPLNLSGGAFRGHRSKECIMVFSSLTFLLLFLPLTLGAYFLRRSISWRNGVLLLASILFYAWGEPQWVFVLILQTFLVWGCSLAGARSESRLLRRILTLVAVGSPLAVLLYAKYAAFLLAPLLSPLGLKVVSVRMPLGISFFTFQIITYAVDVYRTPSQVQKNPLRLLLYISCFPQLVAGPIVRYADVARALGSRQTTLDDFLSGMQRFACGLGKKVLLANLCGRAVSDLISNQQLYGMSTAGGWYMALMYSLQIYFDFSGYSDMAIGLGRVFGFRFLENFNYPYLSRSISEFWRRWHISLGTFFREYVYIPLGGNRCGAARQIFNLLVVWGLTGLWHGASLNFVIWGLYFFLLLVLERFVLRALLSRLPAPCSWLITYLLVLCGWVIFYFTDLTEMRAYLFSLVGAGGQVPLITPELSMVVRQYSFLPLIGLFAAFPLWRHLPLARHRGPALLWTTGIYVLSLLFIVGQSFNPFIYFRF